MKFKMFFRSDTKNKLKHVEDVDKESILKAISSLLDEEKTLRLKIVRV